MAINAPFQGTSADLIKRAMIRISHECDLSLDNTDVKMLVQVHDELVFEVRKENTYTWIEKIRRIMEDVPEFTVPVVVEAKAGASWGDMDNVPHS